MKKHLFLLISLFLLIASGCKEEENSAKALTAIQATPDKLNLAIGNAQQIKTEAVPQDADPNELPFEWKSENPAIATVSASGVVKAVAVGATEVTVSGKVHTNIYKKIPVTVFDPSVPLTNILVSPESLAIEAGESKQITATPEPANATGVLFSWSSQNNNVATVNSSGRVTGKGKGATTITVKSGNVEKTIAVTVSQPLKIMIGGITYKADTLNYSEVSQGIKWFKFNLPEFINGFGTLGKGLVVNTLEIDLSYPENKIEVCPASPATWGNIERPSAMYNRKTKDYAASGYKPVAAVNADFYLLSSSNNTGYAYINNRPIGMEITNGMLVQTPLSSTSGIIIKDNGTPTHSDNLSFSGKVDAGGETFQLKEVNGYAGEGELVLFNNMANSYPTDSAFAWSPYVSTMVSLSYPANGWRVNDRMEFTVTGIDYNVETTIPAKDPYKGKDFNGQGAILVGNGPGTSGNDSKAFLGKLKIGDKVGVKMDVRISGGTVSDQRLNIAGYQGVILQSGTPVNTWNEAHPRTAIGYSQDGKKVYLIVIDGRQKDYSVGATTGQMGTILKALGAYTAVNLDGGGSSCMVVNGEIKNKPSDGSERAVANGIIVVKKEK